MTKDMTSGKVSSLLIGFTIPLVLGNLLQLTYNAADSIIVGRFVGSNALAAVGTANPIMNIAILFISGMCMGASILMSHEYGEKNFEKLQRQVSTTFLGGIVFAVCATLIVIPLVPSILHLINVPDEIFADSASYLQIVMIALTFTFLYNFYANTMRALGDSRTPLLFLGISAAFNIVGDLYFVIVLHMGVIGCAAATAISEFLSAVFCALYIYWKIPVLKLGRKWLIFDKGLFKTTVAYSITSAMQQAVLQIGKVMIQSIVNVMGSILGIAIIAAFNAVNRVDDFAYTPEQNIGHAMTTLLAQNHGAGNKDRMKEGFKEGIKIELIYALILGGICLFAARPIISLFVSADDANAAEVISYGTRYIHFMAFLYMIPALTNGIQGWFRGIGDLKVTLASTFMNMVGRVLAAWLLVSVFNLTETLEIDVFAYANLAGWIVMLAFEAPLLYKSTKELFTFHSEG
jgi:putative MATE family efflux protein